MPHFQFSNKSLFLNGNSSYCTIYASPENTESQHNQQKSEFISKNRIAIYPIQYLKISRQDAFTTIYHPHSHLTKVALHRQEGIIGFQIILAAIKYNTSHRGLTSLTISNWAWISLWEKEELLNLWISCKRESFCCSIRYSFREKTCTLAMK